ncbi:hypothetical protein HK098_005456 [Nowakowskiella sp. JEL0407]|nr:hypothetical protein HK098_005456 [Nowakowskiella sp. JEL0407]
MGTLTHPDYIPIAINSRIETDEILGPLPENWEKSQFENTGRFYYVNHVDQSTSWIDPRTYHIRKHNIDDIVAGELPYGWEESFDENIGIFYIDHVTQTHFLDAPWDPAVREQVLKLRETLEAETKRMQEQLEAEQHNQELELAEAERKIRALEGDRQVLEQEVDGIQKALETPVDGELDRLKNMNDKLESENRELLLAAQAANNELEQVRALIEAEAEQRRALEEYITKLKNEVLEMASPEEFEELRRVDEEVTAQAQAELQELENADRELLEGESDLPALRQRLEMDKAERERLLTLAGELESNKATSNQDPEYAEKARKINEEWLKRLNVHAQKVGTLRQKHSILAKNTVNPDELGFKEKLNLFAQAAIEEGEIPKLPEIHTNPTNDFAVKARETAGVVSPTSEENISGQARPLSVVGDESADQRDSTNQAPENDS